MPKSSKRNKQSRHNHASHPAKKDGPVVSMFKKAKARLTLWTILTTGTSLIGVTSAYFTIFGYIAPKIALQPLPIMSVNDASTTGFVLTNIGSTSIHKVALGTRFSSIFVRYYEPGYVAVSKRKGNEVKESEIGDIREIIRVDNIYDVLPPMKSATMQLPLTMPLEEGIDLEIIAHYRPAWFPFSRDDSFRFITKASENGQIVWLPRPDSAPPQYRDDQPNE